MPFIVVLKIACNNSKQAAGDKRSRETTREQRVFRGWHSAMPFLADSAKFSHANYAYLFRQFKRTISQNATCARLRLFVRLLNSGFSVLGDG